MIHIYIYIFKKKKKEKEVEVKSIRLDMFKNELFNIKRIVTTQFPAAKAGATFQAAMSKGKFQGIIWPTTPT